MKKIALVVLGLVVLPGAALAQLEVPTCSDCTLGLWDEQTLVNNFGQVEPFVQKDIYMGIKLGVGETGVKGMEFSIAGMRNDIDGILVTASEGLWPGWSPVGVSVAAARDTSDTAVPATPGNEGGITGAFQECVPGSVALLKISFISFTPVVDKVFKVTRKYGRSNPNYGLGPIITRCDAPEFTAVNVIGGCYIAGYSGNPNSACALGVEPRTWSGVKQLFK